MSLASRLSRACLGKWSCFINQNGTANPTRQRVCFRVHGPYPDDLVVVRDEVVRDAEAVSISLNDELKA